QCLRAGLLTTLISRRYRDCSALTGTALADTVRRHAFFPLGSSNCRPSPILYSDTLIHPSQKRLETLKALSPLRIIGGSRFGRDHLFHSPALLLEPGDFLSRLD